MLWNPKLREKVGTEKKNLDWIRHKTHQPGRTETIISWHNRQSQKTRQMDWTITNKGFTMTTSLDDFIEFVLNESWVFQTSPLYPILCVRPSGIVPFYSSLGHQLISFFLSQIPHVCLFMSCSARRILLISRQHPHTQNRPGQHQIRQKCRSTDRKVWKKVVSLNASCICLKDHTVKLLSLQRCGVTAPWSLSPMYIENKHPHIHIEIIKKDTPCISSTCLRITTFFLFSSPSKH